MKRTSRAKQSHRERRGYRASRSSFAARIAGNAVFVLLGLSALGLVAALAIAGSHLRSGAAAPARDDSATTNTTAPDGSVWISIRSTSAADLVAAARQSSLFARNRSDTGDHVVDLSRLGTPVFVRPLRRTTPTQGTLPDYYVIPIMNAQGETTDAAELELDPGHTAIHVVAIVTYAQPRARGAIARHTAQEALASMATKLHVQQRGGTQPELVYFPLDAEQQQTGKLVWTSGGQFPADPVWLVQGTDGQEHVIGTDGAVYLSAQIPLG